MRPSGFVLRRRSDRGTLATGQSSSRGALLQRTASFALQCLRPLAERLHARALAAQPLAPSS